MTKGGRFLRIEVSDYHPDDTTPSPEPVSLDDEGRALLFGKVRDFIDGAAGEGLEINGIDAADLWAEIEAVRLSGSRPAQSGEQVGEGAVGEALHPDTADLVDRFSAALKDKLLAAQTKYGRSNDWKRSDWMTECQSELLRHVAKGDPRDVAAYAAFLWNFGWPTSAPEIELDSYDAGLLPEPNGASDDWWQDAMRTELLRAHDFYQDQVAAITALQGQGQAWRGMESAPVNESVDLWDGETRHADCVCIRGQWWDAQDEQPSRVKPTHWMPRPTPPTTEADNGEGKSDD